MKYVMTYSRTFQTTLDYCPDLKAADERAKQWTKNFPAGEVLVLSIYPEGYVTPSEDEKPKLTKRELMVEGMREKINSMLPKEPA